MTDKVRVVKPSGYKIYTLSHNGDLRNHAPRRLETRHVLETLSK